MRRRRGDALRSNFGEWIRKRSYAGGPSIPKERVMEVLLSDAQKGILSYFRKDTLLKTIFDAEPQDFVLKIGDAPREFKSIEVGSYGYNREVQRSWDWLQEHFSAEIETHRTKAAIQSTASKVNGALLYLSSIKPVQHIHWTWPLAAQECFVGIPKPIRYRKGAKRDFGLGDGRLFSQCKEELEQDLQKLMLVYSASKERGIDA